MASIFMRIDGTTPKGAATVDKINGKDGFFAIDSVTWNAVAVSGLMSAMPITLTKEWLH